MTLGRVGVIGRFKPLHKGAAIMLESICEQAAHVIIGVGSSNKYNARNPFTAEESKDMINLVLASRFSNYEILQVPDFGHIPEYKGGQKWKEYVIEHYGDIDHFVSGNDYVRTLLQDDYHIIHPGDIIPKEKWIWLKASHVRVAMAQYRDWKSFVPEVVAEYLEKNDLVDRFREEFGLQTLASLLESDYLSRESAEAEQLHAMEKSGNAMA